MSMLMLKQDSVLMSVKLLLRENLKVAVILQAKLQVMEAEHDTVSNNYYDMQRDYKTALQLNRQLVSILLTKGEASCF